MSAPPKLPLIAIITPVVVGVVVALFFSSPLALAFGVLGPVIALAGWWEARRAHSRQRQLDDERHEQELTVQAQRVEKARADYVAGQRRVHPPASLGLDNPLWRGTASLASPRMRVGTGLVDHPELGPIPDTPVLVEVSGGLGVIGQAPQARALWRAVAVAALAHAGAKGWSVVPPGPLPDADAPDHLVFDLGSPAAGRIEFRFAPRAEDLPSHLRSVLVHSGVQAEYYLDGSSQVRGIRPDQVSFAGWRRALGRFVPPPTPDALEHSDKGRHDTRSQLWCALAEDCRIDLVAQGPHALVWGQTGSGKTVALRRVIDSMVSRYRPEQLTIAMIDFKGGTGALGVEGFDHCAGVLTDLQPHVVSRAQAAIQAEIEGRERTLAGAGVADISCLSATAAMSRLVIVIDEVALLLQRYPAWEALLSDLAARGRALGIHLVIAGQRLIGQVPRSIVVNAPIRVCLRVQEASEALEFLPGATPALLETLRQRPSGTALVLTATTMTRMIRVDNTPPAKPQGGQSTPLWLPPLPENIAEGLSADNGKPAWALCDEPALTRQRALGLVELPSDLVAILGDPHQGHTTALNAIGHSAPADSLVVFPEQPAEFVDALLSATTVDKAAGRSQVRVGIIDRIDRICRGFQFDQLEWVVEMLSEWVHAASDTSSFSSLVVSAAAQSDIAKLILRRQPTLIGLPIANKESWMSAGFPEASWRSALPPGRAWWRGGEIQFASPAHPPSVAATTPCPSAESMGPGILISGTQTPPVIPGWRGYPAHEADGAWREIEHAKAHSRLLLHELTRDGVKAIAGHPAGLLPPAGSSRAWLLDSGLARLVSVV